MYPITIVAAAVGLLSVPALASPVETRDVLAELQDRAMSALVGSGAGNKRSSCNIFNARYRRDWFVIPHTVSVPIGGGAGHHHHLPESLY